MRKARKYEDGGSFDWGGLAGGALSVLGSAYKLADIDTDSLEDRVDAEMDAMESLKLKPASDSLDSLVQQRLGYRGLSTDYDTDDYYIGPKDSDIWGGILGGAVAGAKAGSALGALGAIGGGILGAGANWLGAYTGKTTAEKEAQNSVNKLIAKADSVNRYNIGSFREAGNTAYENEMTRQKRNIIAYGGPLFAFGGALPGYGGNWSDGLTFIKNGNTHEQNPIGGVPMGMAQDGTPNLVEQGEVVWNDYVFSNRIGVPKSVREKFQLKGGDNMTFAEAVEKAQKASAERPNDPIEKRTLDTLLAGLMQEQETIRQEKAQKEQFSQMEDMAAFAADGGPIHIAKNKRGTFTAAATKHGMGVQEFAGHVLANKDKYSPAMVKKANFARNAAKWHALGGHLFYDGGIKPYPLRVQNTSKPEETNTALPTSGWQTMLRYAPVVGGIGTVFSDLMGWTNKPDYQYADAIDAAAERATSGYTHVGYTPLGDYLAYNPFDRLFYANELGAQQAATRRGILNLSNGNRGTALAGLLAADYSGNIGLGKLFREGEEYNLAQRQKVAEFNRGTNMYNSEADLKAQIANAEMDRARANLLYEAALKSNLMRQQEDQTSAAAKAANLTSLFDNLGNLGIDAYNRYDRNALINAGVFGTLSQKPQGVSDADWEEYQKYFRKIYGRAEGGKLRKKKKGLTI